MPKPRTGKGLLEMAAPSLSWLLASRNATLSADGQAPSSNLVPLSTLLTSVASIIAAGAVASLSPLWQAFSELTWAEWGTVFLPPLAYWTYSMFLTFVPPMFPSFANKFRLHPNTERANRVTPGEVVRTVIVQHLMQMTVAFIVAVLTRGQGEADSWPVIGLKLAAGAFILDGYEYWVHRWVDEAGFRGSFRPPIPDRTGHLACLTSWWL